MTEETPGTSDPVAQIRVQCRSGEKLNPAGASATGGRIVKLCRNRASGRMSFVLLGLPWSWEHRLDQLWRPGKHENRNLSQEVAIIENASPSGETCTAFR